MHRAISTLVAALLLLAVAAGPFGAPAAAAGLPVASGNSAFPDLPTLLTANANGMVWETLNAADQPTLWAVKLDSGALVGDPAQLTGSNFTHLTANGVVPASNLSIAGSIVAGAGDPFTSFGAEQQRVSMYDLASGTATNPIITGFGDGGSLNDSVFFASAAPDGMVFLALEVPGSGPSTVHVMDEDMARDTPVDLGTLPDASTDPSLLADVRGTTTPAGSVIAYPTTLTDGSGHPEDNLAFVPFNGDGPSVLATGGRDSFDDSLVTGGGRVAWADYEPGGNNGCDYYALPLDGSGNGTPTAYNPAGFCDTLDGITATSMVLSAVPVEGGKTGDGVQCPLTLPTCAGGKLATLDLATGGVTRSASVDALSAATDGTSLFVTQGSALGSAGIYSAAGATSPESLLRPAPARPLSADDVALSLGRVTWSDDSAASYPVSTRTLTPDGTSLDLGPPQNVAATTLPRSPFDGYGVSASGGRTAFAVPPARPGGDDELVVREPDGTTRTVTTYAGGTPTLPQGGPLPGTVQVSGTNVLYLTADPTAGYDAHLYSTASQTTRDFGPAAAFALSGGYLAWVANDGSVWRQDIVADTAPVQLRAPTPLSGDQTAAIGAEVMAAGDYVGWLVRECVTASGNSTCGGNTEAAYRDAATMDPAQVVLTTPTTPAPGTSPAIARHIAMSDAYLLVDELNTGLSTPGNRTLVAVKLADGSSTTIASNTQYVSGAGKFAAAGSTIAWIDPGGAPQVEALDTDLETPRVLTLDTPSSIETGRSKSFEIVASAPLSTCTVRIAIGATTVRSLDCAAADGDGIVGWDGTDDQGSPVSPGTYGWTVVGANGAGSLLDYTGSNEPITGTVKVLGATTTQASWPTSIVQGGSFSVTADVTATSATPTGIVSLKADGTTLASQPLAGGAATLDVAHADLAPGSHTLTVSYGGSDTLAPSSASKSVTVTAEESGPANLEKSGTAPAPAAAAGTVSAVSATWPSRVIYGKSFAVDVNVATTGAPPIGTVTLTSGSATLASQTLAGGRATLTVGGTELRPGKHALAVRYGGSPTTAPSSVEQTLTVAKARAKVKASLSRHRVSRSQRAKLTVRVAATGTRPTGTVRVLDGKSRLATIRLSAAKEGKAVVMLPKLGKPGKHKIQAIYGGSSLVAPAAGKPQTLTVKPSPALPPSGRR